MWDEYIKLTKIEHRYWEFSHSLRPSLPSFGWYKFLILNRWRTLRRGMLAVKLLVKISGTCHQLPQQIRQVYQLSCDYMNHVAFLLHDPFYAH